MDELHFSVKSFRDSIVAREAPHTGNRFEPVAESSSEGLHWLGLTGCDIFDVFEEVFESSSALFFGLMFGVYDFSELMHLLINGLKDGMSLEEFIESLFLF